VPQRQKRTKAKRTPPLRPYFIGALVAVLAVGAVVIIGGLTRDSGPSPTAALRVPAPRPADIPLDGRVRGEPGAPVEVVEYLDFQCPICLRAEFEVVPELDERFVRPGTARMETRPIAILGDESVQAAAAAECAGDQGQFWAFHDILFANWAGENDGAFSDARLKEMAALLELDTTAFDSCLDSSKYVEQVAQATEAARSAGVSGTPTFFVDGLKVKNTTQDIAAAIEAAAGQ
jgi:protein-disulfide isomerase